MNELLANMDSTLQFYWITAIISSIIFVIQTIMTFIGADADTGMDADFDGNLEGGDHPFQLFSLRNMVSFLLGFGWAGVVFYDIIANYILLALVAFLVGAFFVFIFFLIMKSLMNLSEDNSFKIEDTMGVVGNVYIKIPPSKSGKGKVQISVKGATHELPATTINEEALLSGSQVRVVAIEGDALVVEKL